MNLALKALILKEVTEVTERKWYRNTVLLYIIIYI